MLHNRITGITFADLERIDLDECEVQNRLLDAWLEAEHVARKNKGAIHG